MRSVIDQLISRIIIDSLDRVDDGAVYVTELVSCPMKYYLRRRYPSLGIQLTFNEKVLLGRIIHEGIESLLDRVADVSVEYPVETIIDGITIRGRADIVTPDSVIEVKTTRNPNNIPHENHILQASIYANLLGKSQAILLYIVANNNVKFLEYTVDPATDELLHQLVNELKEKKPVPRYDWECNYCPFRAVCPARVSKQ